MIKQFILPAQFQELSDEAKKIYLEWCEKNNLISKSLMMTQLIDRNMYSWFSYVAGDPLVPLLSLGEMLSFLREHGMMHVLVQFTDKDDTCDELWYIVKTVLEESATKNNNTNTQP